jgi:hypothetical protein
MSKQFNCEEFFQNPEVLDELRYIGIPVKDDFDNYYPLDKICYNYARYLSQDKVDNVNQESTPNLYWMLTSTIHRTEVDYFFAKILKDKLDPLDVSISYKGNRMVGYKIPCIWLVNYSPQEKFNMLDSTAKKLFEFIFSLPLDKNIIKDYYDNENTWLNIANYVSNIPFLLDVLKDCNPKLYKAIQDTLNKQQEKNGNKDTSVE